MAKDIEYQFLNLIKNGRICPDYPLAWKAYLLQHEGQKVYMSITPERFVPKSKEQLAYYMGGIIRGTLMRTTKFEGYSHPEIDKVIRRAVREETAVLIDKKGNEETFKFTNAEIEKYDIKEMSNFINDVLDWLAIKFDIHPLPPEYYKQGKYLIDKRKQK